MTTVCKVIAEAGVNHNGSMELAHSLVDLAVQSGADYVKFQTFQADKLTNKSNPQAEYQKRNNGNDQTQYEMLKKLELPLEGFRDLSNYCAQKKIGFLSTPFDLESAHFLASIGMSMMKVSSGDLTNLPFLRALASMHIPIILSTGMATLGEVEQALNVVEQAGLKSAEITILHCTTEYPAPPEEVNLKAMQTLRVAFPRVHIGYSDHTEGIAVSLAAVALGAEVIEKHFTLDKTMPGPDHKASIELAELSALVNGVRTISSALGDGRKQPTPTETKNIPIARKSIFVTNPIKQGEVFSEHNLTIRRPGNGCSPMHWDKMIGKVATRDYSVDETLE